MANNLLEAALLEENLWTRQVLSRGDFLVRAGEVTRHIFQVEEGAIRAFYVSEHEEHTIRFGYRGSLITSLKSFYRNQPSEFYWQAIRKTTLLVAGKADFRRFLEAEAGRMKEYTYYLEQLVLSMMERELDLLTQSPTERVRRVMERSPQLFQEIPAKYIAAYLRMTPETFSRIQNS